MITVYEIRLTAILAHYKNNGDYLGLREELVKLQGDVFRTIQTRGDDSNDLNIFFSLLEQMLDEVSVYEYGRPNEPSIQSLIDGSHDG